MVGLFFSASQVVEVEAQRGDPRMDTRDPRDMGRPPARDTREMERPPARDPRGPANPPDPRGGDTASPDRPWRDILKNCRQMKKAGKLSREMRQECKRARAMKKGRR